MIHLVSSARIRTDDRHLLPKPLNQGSRLYYPTVDGYIKLSFLQYQSNNLYVGKL